VALLATDPSHLKAEGVEPADLKGVICVSGVYRIPPGKVKVTLGGSGPHPVGVDQLLPVRGDGKFALNFLFPAFPATVNIYGRAFGEDPKVRISASPLAHVRPGLPPFLILVSKNDLPTLPGMAHEFHQALFQAGTDVRLVELDHRNHNSVIFSAVTPDDPSARAIQDFVHKK
jgi:hypothetical protein